MQDIERAPAKKMDFPVGSVGVFGLGLLAAAAVNVHTAQADDVDLALGKQVFEGNCAACHAGGGNTVINDHTLFKDAIEKYLDGGYNITAITYQVILLNISVMYMRFARVHASAALWW